MQVTDEWLYEKMPIVDAAIIQRLEEHVGKDYVFSNQFTKVMHRLIKRETYMDAAKLVKKIAQRAAVIVLIMFLGALAVPMSVKAYQSRLFHTIKTIFDGKIGIYSYESYAITDGKLADTILCPSYIPDGYELTDENHTATSTVLEYSKANRHLIYNQKIISSEKMIFDMSFDRMERMTINGMTVLVYWYQDDTFWAYGEYGNSIYILAGDSIKTDEIQKIYKHWIW